MKEGIGPTSFSFLDLVGRVCLSCSHFDLCSWLFGDQLILSDSSWPLLQNFREMCSTTVSGRRDCSVSWEMITFAGMQLQGRQGEKPAAALWWLLWRPSEVRGIEHLKWNQTPNTTEQSKTTTKTKIKNKTHTQKKLEWGKWFILFLHFVWFFWHYPVVLSIKLIYICIDFRKKVRGREK